MEFALGRGWKCRLGLAVAGWALGQVAWAQASAANGGAPSAGAGASLFAVHCARCHGVDAGGTASAPNLRLRVQGMSVEAFSAAVLRRYRWTLPATGAGGESAARDAMIHGVLQPLDGSAAMPAWEDNPAVALGVQSLYLHLTAPR